MENMRDFSLRPRRPRQPATQASSPQDIPSTRKRRKTKARAPSKKPTRKRTAARNTTSRDGRRVRRNNRRLVPMTISFLDLPREIRDIVYFHALSPTEHWRFPEGRVVQIASGCFVPSANHDVPGISLLRVNKRVHDEAAAVLYSSNKFYFPENDLNAEHGIIPFLSAIGNANAAQIRHIALRHTIFGLEFKHESAPEPCTVREFIRETCTELRSLDIIGPTPWEQTYSKAPLSFKPLDGLVRCIRGFSIIDQELAQKLPRLQRTELVVWGPRRHVSDSKTGFTVVLAGAIELGWSVSRREVFNMHADKPRRKPVYDVKVEHVRPDDINEPDASSGNLAYLRQRLADPRWPIDGV